MRWGLGLVASAGSCDGYDSASQISQELSWASEAVQLRQASSAASAARHMMAFSLTSDQSSVQHAWSKSGLQFLAIAPVYKP